MRLLLKYKIEFGFTDVSDGTWTKLQKTFQHSTHVCLTIRLIQVCFRTLFQQKSYVFTWLRAAPNLVKEIATGAFKVFSSAAFSTAERSNWVARPGIVGRKNGAALGFLGGAFGLFLALITSRFNRFSHLQNRIK